MGAPLPAIEPSPPAGAREALLESFEPRRAAYPWRRHPDPYHVLVGEVMAQQTQVSRAVTAFGPFLERFPTVEVLARASRAAVVRAWAGLGYNRRAVALHEAARAIVRDHGGRIPREVERLRALPGVGPYTAAAVASIAYGEPVAAIDSNVRRVMGRVTSGMAAHSPSEVSRAAETWLDPDRPGSWNQAVMDLGRTVCRPSHPRCDDCPLRPSCAFVAAGGMSYRPLRAGSRPVPRFEGSNRQARGAVIRELRIRGTASEASIAEGTGIDRGRIAAAVAELLLQGLVAGTGTRLRLHSGRTG